MPPTSENVEVTLAATARGEDSATARAFGIAVAGRDETRWQFVSQDGRMLLCSPRSEGPMRLEICAGAGGLARRLRTARSTDPLARAVGLGKRKNLPTVIDATAGLCRDAMVLAHLGCSVTAIELVSALALWSHWNIEAAGLADRLRIVRGDAVGWLAALETDQRPAVVYLDPMFARPGKAQVKKEMQACRLLAGRPQATDPLVAVARRTAVERVVIKRHPDHPPLADDVSFTVESDRVRFDVYLTPPETPLSEDPTP